MSVLKSISDFLFGDKHYHMEATEYVKRGIAKISLDDLKGAMHDFTSAINESPDYAEAYYNRGLLHDYFNDTAAATEDLLTAKELFEKQGNADRLARIDEKLQELGQGGHKEGR